MDKETLTERLHELQVSLKDGDDLARAIGLIGDALQRRMEVIRTSLEDLDGDRDGLPDAERLAEIIRRVSGTLDRYEEEIETRRQRMEVLVEEFQVSLGGSAEELDELAVSLGGERVAANDAG